MAMMNAPHKTMSLVLVLRFLNIVVAAESAFSLGVSMTLLGPNDISREPGSPFFPAGQHSSPQMAGLRKPKFGAHRRYLNKSQVIPVVPPAHRPYVLVSIHNLDTAAKESNRHLPHGLRADTQGWRDAR